MNKQTSLTAYIQQSIRDNWELEALCDMHGASLTYKDVARKIAKLHIFFEKTGIKKGDKIALCGRNSANWSVAAMACLTYGAVAVPILNEFKPDTIHHLVNDCDAKLLFTTGTQWNNLDGNCMPALSGIIRLHDYSILLSRSKKLTEVRSKLNLYFGEKYPDRFAADDVAYPAPDPTTLALINYTSGSSGFSKGVMLSHKNLWSNIQFCIDGLTFLKPSDGMVCMLPLAHMYGFVVEMLHPFVKGCNIHFLSRTPSPRVIMEAFASVKPKLVITVPLILEKIIKSKVFPIIEKPVMTLLLKVPVINDRILAKIRAKILDVFGGQLKEIIIGGAALNKDVEAFLRKIQFPFTVGYGMTECAPLVAYCPWDKQKPGSCGRIAPRMEMKVDSPDGTKTPGVLMLRGDNVMMGYYKNPTATAEALKGGWLNTGDICTIDGDGYIYLRGRDKNMILGPSGQNIYPEEIEQKLNNMPLVAESLVIDDGDGKLAALIYPDIESATAQGIPLSQLESLMHDNIKLLNKELPAYSQIRRLKIHHEEFEKTPKRSIKRFLYTHN